MSPWDFFWLGLAVLSAFGYGYLEGRVAGFRRGVKAAKEEDER